LIAKFKIFDGPICCEEEIVISIVKASVVLHSFVRMREGVFCEVDEISTVNQSAFPTEHEEDGGRQRLSMTQLLRNHLADSFLTPAGAIPPQWVYVS
jgi:hypothetical protein